MSTSFRAEIFASGKHPLLQPAFRACLRCIDLCSDPLALAGVAKVGILRDHLRNSCSGKKLRGCVIAAVIAWAAHHVGFPLVRMEAHMKASITLQVQGEANGSVGTLGVR